MTQSVIGFFSLLTLISNFVVILIIAIYLFGRIDKTGKKYWEYLKKILEDRVLLLGFLVSLTAMLGSLYFSEIARLEPCKLCWFQRIFMYPQFIIFGVALYKKTKDALKYILPLNIVGGLIAIYHYYYQVNPKPLVPCSSIGFSVSCSERFVTHFGYITIPWMSFSAFLIIFLVSLSKLRNKGNS